MGAVAALGKYDQFSICYVLLKAVAPVQGNHGIVLSPNDERGGGYFFEAMGETGLPKIAGEQRDNTAGSRRQKGHEVAVDYVGRTHSVRIVVTTAQVQILRGFAGAARMLQPYCQWARLRIRMSSGMTW